MRSPKKRKVLAICGPTASGKTELADNLADSLTESYGVHIKTLVIDSMQVYRELPVITNQLRRRPAELVGIASVTEEWSVARHRAAADAVLSGSEGAPAVLDAGTGMYLNAVALDVELAPRVSPEMRAAAQRLAAGSKNPRRAAREIELRLAGVPERGSIWEGEPRFDLELLYLRPDRRVLDRAVQLRSGKIAGGGIREAERILEIKGAGGYIPPTVEGAIGVWELTRCVLGEMSLQDAQERISTRTRALTRRQMRWFDKLVRTLSGRANVLVAESPSSPEVSNFLNCMHDRIST